MFIIWKQRKGIAIKIKNEELGSRLISNSPECVDLSKTQNMHQIELAESQKRNFSDYRRISNKPGTSCTQTQDEENNIWKDEFSNLQKLNNSH
mmetsp:Transcript_29516/g.26100  ORF Transcript_29516/g.26100 Transcript_29516/m.26100 type:complete len:93 (+) Transcript_29516:479-757(+)